MVQTKQTQRATTQQKQGNEPKQAPTRSIRAVFGDMVDPFTNVTYTQSPQPAGEIREGSWLDVQVRAGKLELC